MMPDPTNGRVRGRVLGPYPTTEMTGNPRRFVTNGRVGRVLERRDTPRVRTRHRSEKRSVASPSSPEPDQPDQFTTNDWKSQYSTWSGPWSGWSGLCQNGRVIDTDAFPADLPDAWDRFGCPADTLAGTVIGSGAVRPSGRRHDPAELRFGNRHVMTTGQAASGESPRSQPGG